MSEVNFNNEKLVDLRWQHRMKQNHLARLVGVAQPVVCIWEKGRKKPSTESLLKLAKIFNVTVEYFFD